MRPKVKRLLARYVGWGGMPNVFGHYPPAEWRDTAAAVTTFSWRLWQSGNFCCEQP